MSAQFEGSAEQRRILKLRDVEGLLIEADAIVKLCAGADPLPGDTENALQATALQAASRLLNEAMVVLDRDSRAS